MPTTRKKVIKTVYEDEEDSEAEKAAGDFSDSGSDAKISDYSSSEDEDGGSDVSSDHVLKDKPKPTPSIINKTTKTIVFKNKKSAKEYINRMKERANASRKRIVVEDHVDSSALLAGKELTDAKKPLPSFIDLSKSDSSEDESPKSKQSMVDSLSSRQIADFDSEVEKNVQYKDTPQNLTLLPRRHFAVYRSVPSCMGTRHPPQQ